MPQGIAILKCLRMQIQTFYCLPVVSLGYDVIIFDEESLNLKVLNFRILSSEKSMFTRRVLNVYFEMGSNIW